MGSHSNKGLHLGGNLVLFGLFRAHLRPCAGVWLIPGALGGAEPALNLAAKNSLAPRRDERLSARPIIGHNTYKTHFSDVL